MKNLFLFAFLSIFIFACNSNSTDSDEDTNSDEQNVGESKSGKKYVIESGYIVYKMDMMGMSSKTTQYFKNYGKTEATVTHMEMMGQKIVSNTIRKDDYMYSFQTGQTTGTKIKMDEGAVAEGEMGVMDEKIIEEMGGKKVGTEKMLGKDCDVYEVEKDGGKSKFWVWKNMLFKMTAMQNNMEVSMEAIELKETSDFPAGIFDIPQNIQFSEPELNMESEFDMEGAEG